MLFVLAGVTFWTLGQKPEIGPELLKKLKMISRFKETLPGAEAGDAQAQYNIALMYQTGDGTAKAPEMAVKWLLKAAEQGHAKARYQLGWWYANGIIVRQDYFLAAKYYRLAATFNKDPEAQFRLGELYFNGRGVPNDYAKAIQYYDQAARQGHGAAQFILSSMYIEGWGVKRDLIVAYVWLKLSQGKRDQTMAVNKRFDPVKKMKQLKSLMNQYQIDEAEKRLQRMTRRG